LEARALGVKRKRKGGDCTRELVDDGSLSVDRRPLAGRYDSGGKRGDNKNSQWWIYG